MLRTTPFHPRTEALCEARNWRRWAGYLSASAYELHHDREYWAIRNSAGLIDVSPLHKYRIAGPDAEPLMNRIVTRDVSRCAVHQVLYTPWCDEAGKVMDDGTLARLATDDFRLTSAMPNLRWLQDNARGMDVRVTDISDEPGGIGAPGSQLPSDSERGGEWRGGRPPVLPPHESDGRRRARGDHTHRIHGGSRVRDLDEA